MSLHRTTIAYMTNGENTRAYTRRSLQEISSLITSVVQIQVTDTAITGNNMYVRAFSRNEYLFYEYWSE